MRRLALFLGYNDLLPTTLCEDNQGAISYIKSKESHGRMKHIDVKIKYIRQSVDDSEINLVSTSSIDNLADVLTKVLPLPSFTKHRLSLGVQSFSTPEVITPL